MDSPWPICEPSSGSRASRCVVPCLWPCLPTAPREAKRNLQQHKTIRGGLLRVSCLRAMSRSIIILSPPDMACWAAVSVIEIARSSGAASIEMYFSRRRSLLRTSSLISPKLCRSCRRCDQGVLSDLLSRCRCRCRLWADTKARSPLPLSSQPPPQRSHEFEVRRE